MRSDVQLLASASSPLVLGHSARLGGPVPRRHLSFEMTPPRLKRLPPWVHERPACPCPSRLARKMCPSPTLQASRPANYFVRSARPPQGFMKPYSRRSKSLSTKAVQISMTAPQIAATRMARMAAVGPFQSPADRQEMTLMVNEKVLAFWQSWMAMWVSAASLPWKLAGSPASMGPRALEQVLHAGLVPVHAAVMSNRRRLSRTR